MTLDYIEAALPPTEAGPGRDPAAPGRAAPLLAYSLAELLEADFPVRRPLLYRGEAAVLRAGHLGQVVAGRGIGKSWFLQTLALVASCGVEALGFRAGAPCRVLLIDGEMAATELQTRFEHLCRITGAKPGANLTVLAADWQRDFMARLDTPEGQAAVWQFVEPADLVILDNRSCLLDPESEKDAAAWQPAQDWLLSLRRLGKAALAAHHSNRQGGARGHSRPEDVMNLCIKLARPDGYSPAEGARFRVEFDKARGLHGDAVAPFVAALDTEHGWLLEGAEAAEDDANTRKLLDYLRVADDLGERPKSANRLLSLAGIRSKERGLAAIRTLLEAGRIRKGAAGYECA